MDKLEKYLTEKDEYEMENGRYIGYNVIYRVESEGITYYPRIRKTSGAAPHHAQYKNKEEAKKAAIKDLEKVIKEVKKL